MVSRRAMLSIVFLTIVAAGISYPSARMLDRHAPLTATAARAPMKPFPSEEELLRFLEELGKRQRRQRRGGESVTVADAVVGGIASPSPQASPAFSSGQAAPVSITNTQHAGVDEGDIVKVHGEHLVILRRGRLFTIALADIGLTPVSSIDAFAPDIDPRRTWYDEMLVAGDAIVVIGYSYERGGTEIGLFDIDTKGNLSYRSTYHLRSNDYYSSRNYASRLLGSKLVFYAPLYIDATGPVPTAWLPALRRWRSGATHGDFQRIIEPSRIYPPFDDSALLTLHTVTVCDLAHREMTCEATGVMGPPGRVFYVSPDSVYVWMTPWSHTAAARHSLLYRLPLDGSEPSALRARGAPIDQFSFLQSGDDHLNVLLRADAPGDTMWHAEGVARGVALLRVPLTDLDGNAPEAAAAHYRVLPSPDGNAFRNRFVGEYVLYGTGTTWNRLAPRDSDGLLYAYRFVGDDAPVSLPLGHAVERIEAMGHDAIVVGGGGRDLYFTAVGLRGGRPRLGGRFTEQAALQGELRSHGFFYTPDGEASGMFGLPVRSAGQSGAAHLRHDSAFVRYVRNHALNFSDAGRLVADGDGRRNDGCRASCVDWYGNARPIFWRDRLFALLGYEIVEGRVDEGRVQEWRRVSFAPSGTRGTQ